MRQYHVWAWFGEEWVEVYCGPDARRQQQHAEQVAARRGWNNVRMD